MAQREAMTITLPYVEDAELEDFIQGIIEDSMGNSERSRWAADHKIGVSDIGHCLAGETEVPTLHGVVPIESLAGRKETLLVPSGSRAVWREVEVKAFGVQPLMKITLSKPGATRVIHATAEHQWFVTGSTGSRDYRLATTSNLAPGDRMKQARAGNPLVAEVVPAAACMGFIHGDGSRYHSVSEVTVALNGNKMDCEVIPWIRALSRSATVLDHGVRFRGMPRSWKDVPNFAYESPSFALSWIAGYFAADGSVDRRGGCTIQSSDLSSIKAVRHAAVIAGVSTNPIRTRVVRGGYGLADEQERVVHTISISRRSVPEWFFLNSHHRSIIESLTGEARDSAWVVSSVEETDRNEVVYCAIVPGEEAFVLTEGLVTHNCREYVRRMLMQLPFSDDEPDRMAAFVGTAVGDHVEQKMGEGWKTQQTIVVEMDVDTPGGPVRLNLPGHPDAYRRDRVLDLKTTYSLDVKSKYGPSLQQKFQVSLYADALIKAGEVDPDPTLSVVYMDRSARGGSRPVVYSWKFDPTVVEAARSWLGDVFEAMVLGNDAPRDMERHWCMDWCPFATDCRGEDTDVEGLLEDEVAAAARVYMEASKAEREAKVRKDQAKGALVGVSGRTRDGMTVRTVTVPPSFIAEGWRGGYERIYVSPGKSDRAKS